MIQDADFPSNFPGIYGNTVAYMLDGRWAQAGPNLGFGSAISLVTDPDPTCPNGIVVRLGAPSGASNSGLWPRVRKVLPTPWTEGGQTVQVYINSLPTQDQKTLFVDFNDNANATQFGFYVMTTGQLRFYRGSTANILGTTDDALVSNAWQSIEVKGLIDDAAGEIEVRVDGISWLTIAAADTKGTANTTVAQISYYVAQTDFAGGGNIHLKDFVWWDTSGTHNNDFLGNVFVYPLLTDGDTDVGDWTPSTGTTLYNLLDESPPNDADYISAAAPPSDPAIMTMTDLPSDVTSVLALVPIIRGRKTDGGDGQVQVGLISNAVVGLGTDRPLTTASTYWWDVSEENPDTTDPWEPSEVNAAEVQIDRTL